MRLVGSAPVEETLTAGTGLARRLYGWRRFSFFIYIAVLAAEAGVWMGLPDAVGMNGSLAGLGLAATTVLIIFGYVRWCRSLGPRGWARLGASPAVNLRYEVGDSGIEITSSSGVVTSMPWSAMLSLCRERTLWLLITTGGGTFYLPRRFFTDAVQEKTFVTCCLENMSPDARARSGEAVAFVAGS
jgi:hypothetical protein